MNSRALADDSRWVWRDSSDPVTIEPRRQELAGMAKGI